MATNSARLPFDDEFEDHLVAGDRAARERAVDPRFNVVLEASAGTGKTRVLVDRYVNLLRAGVDPSNILAMTFTRKAAAEMRDRIMSTLGSAAERGEIDRRRWRELRDRTGDIAISTIDAFCLSLLREFPLEADVDPGFSVADPNELPRLIDEALDRALRICRAAARDDEDVALLFAELGERRIRTALGTLLEHRLSAPRILNAYLARGAESLDGAAAARRAADRLFDVLDSMRGGIERFLGTGPLDPAFDLLKQGLRQLRTSVADGDVDPSAAQAVLSLVRDHFLTQEGKPRTRSPYPKRMFANAADWQTHSTLVTDHAAAVHEAFSGLRADLNVLLARGVRRLFAVASAEYRRTLDTHAVLDFSDLLLRAVGLLRRMDEFSRSRYRLESRYHHVLVDEFQDTSRPQWELVALLIQSWGEGIGLADGPLRPSIFIVGDRKQSIYGFRDADVAVLREAARHIEMLRPERDVRRSIARSFRGVPALLAFVNDVCQDMDRAVGSHAFEYREDDRFPIESRALDPSGQPLGLIAASTPEDCARIAADEIARILAEPISIRDRDTGLARPLRAGDIAILFRSRDSHREFEAALANRGVRTHVYKGLGFFDADETKDLVALIRYLAEPSSDLRSAALMRSRFFGLSDEGLRRIAPKLSDVLGAACSPAEMARLDTGDAAALASARRLTAGWRALVDRVPAAELLDHALSESGYLFELRGIRLQQARENLKKIRALVRRLENRGYATMPRIAAHLDRLALGDEANAPIDAVDAVNLMTVHASKGLEFPIVFLVNLARGTGNRRPPVRWSPDASDEAAAVAVGSPQAEVDDAREARDREETKRLLYVALTRARDRLYLSTTLKDGRVFVARGSLAEVLPATLLDQFAAATNTGTEGEMAWTASSGAVHRFRTCRSESIDTNVSDSVRQPHSPVPHPMESELESEIDFEPLPAPDVAARRAAGNPATGLSDGAGHLVGLMVHRLMHRYGLQESSELIRPDEALRLLRPEEVAGMAGDGTPAEAARQAVAAFRSIATRPDVRAVYESGDRFHEVPFTMRTEGVVVRGTIDCLIRTPDRVVILEFKTGRPQPDHQAQVDVYRSAASRVFPGATVEALLVYATDGPDRGRPDPVQGTASG